MSFEGFSRYMSSSECLLFSKEFNNVYQDMHHPLNDYFISSSHNTYLVSDQLVGPSDIWGYERYVFEVLNFLHFKTLGSSYWCLPPLVGIPSKNRLCILGNHIRKSHFDLHISWRPSLWVTM